MHFYLLKAFNVAVKKNLKCCENNIMLFISNIYITHNFLFDNFWNNIINRNAT